MSVSKKKDSFLMYRTWRGVFDNPDDHFVAQLIRAVFAHRCEDSDKLREIYEDTPSVQGALYVLGCQFTGDDKKYQAQCDATSHPGTAGNPNFKKGCPNPYYPKKDNQIYSDIIEDNRTYSKIIEHNQTYCDKDKDKDYDNDSVCDNKRARDTHTCSHWAITEANDTCPWDDRYRRFNDWMKEKAEYCAKHMQRITPEQFGRVLDGKEDFGTGRTMTEDDLLRMIDDIENKAGSNRHYKKLWTTVRNFWRQDKDNKK